MKKVKKMMEMMIKMKNEAIFQLLCYPVGRSVVSISSPEWNGKQWTWQNVKLPLSYLRSSARTPTAPSPSPPPLGSAGDGWLLRLLPHAGGDLSTSWCEGAAAAGWMDELGLWFWGASRRAGRLSRRRVHTVHHGGNQPRRRRHHVENYLQV